MKEFAACRFNSGLCAIEAPGQISNVKCVGQQCCRPSFSAGSVLTGSTPGVLTHEFRR